MWDEITYPFLNFNGCGADITWQPKHKCWCQWPLLLTWFNFNLGMDKLFHPTLYNGCNYLSMLGLVTSHYLNQCWNIINWTHRNKLQWKLNRNSYIFIQENVFENVVWIMPAICLGLNVLKQWGLGKKVMKWWFGFTFGATFRIANDDTILAVS